MISGVHHIGLQVDDAAQAAAFYNAVAGFATAHSSTNVVLVAAPNAYLEFAPSAARSGEALPHPPINALGIRHFCIQNRDGQMLADRTVCAGGSLFADPLDLGTGNQYAYARDLEGNVVELEGLPYAPEGERTWIGHVAIVTNDMDRLLSFYATLLRHDPVSKAKVGPGPQFDKMGGLPDVRLEGAWINAGNMLLEFWHFRSPISPVRIEPASAGVCGYTHVCFESDDIARDFETLIAAGGAPISAPVESEGHRVAYGRDPDGNTLKLLEPRRGSALTIAALADPNIRRRIEAGKA